MKILLIGNRLDFLNLTTDFLRRSDSLDGFTILDRKNMIGIVDWIKNQPTPFTFGFIVIKNQILSSSDNKESGPEIVGGIRKIPGYEDIPIVIFGVSTSSSSEEKEYPEGSVTDFIDGPLFESEFVKKFKEYLKIST